MRHDRNNQVHHKHSQMPSRVSVCNVPSRHTNHSSPQVYSQSDLDAHMAGSKHKRKVAESTTPARTDILSSNSAIATCERVLRAVARHPPSLGTNKNFRGIRRALNPFLHWQQSGNDDYAVIVKGGNGAEERQSFRGTKLSKRFSHRQFRKQAIKAHDEAALNKSALRAERIRKLQQLLADNKAQLAAITAGRAEDEGGVAIAEERAPAVDIMVPDGTASAHDELAARVQDAFEDKRRTVQAQVCYICKAQYHRLHVLYADLCPDCAELNYSKRFQTADMRGRVALVTGGRVKIGWRIGLKLLRCGAIVVVTSRFPHDAAKRYAAEKDASSFMDRLHVVGLDLRDMARLEEFCAMLKTKFKRMDVIINNACQTVRRPAAYYQHLLQAERVPPRLLVPAADTPAPSSTSEGAPSTPATAPPSQDAATESDASDKSNKHARHDAEEKADKDPAGVLALDRQWRMSGAKGNELATQSASSAEMSQLPVCVHDLDRSATKFPKGMYDVNRQQLDLRSQNSWKLKLEQVESAELAEVFAINAMSPFIINARLKPLLLQAEAPRFIVNVSAMEGKFYRKKSSNHPHTNMAKAALNMMTRTSAAAYAREGIYMNSVDTGWINDENPLPSAVKMAVDHNFQTPLDEIDAAARVVDPVMVGLNGGELVYGKFLKDYKETEW